MECRKYDFFLVRTGGDATMTKIGTAYAFISKLRGDMQSLKGDYNTKYGGIWINPMEWDTKIVPNYMGI